MPSDNYQRAPDAQRTLISDIHRAPDSWDLGRVPDIQKDHR